MAKRRQKLELKIVLDTNAIFTDGETNLLRREMSDVVRSNRGDTHLVIQWILPEVVLNERRYQMQREAAGLLPHLSRLERVIGHPLNITEQVTDARISENVARQVNEHGLTIRSAAYADIDWTRLVNDAVNRNPPFERKGEKGFRDAVTSSCGQRGHRNSSFISPSKKPQASRRQRMASPT